MESGPCIAFGRAENAIPSSLKGIAIRFLDGKPKLIMFFDDATSVTYELRPAQLQQIACEASKIAWANYNLMERDTG